MTFLWSPVRSTSGGVIDSFGDQDLTEYTGDKASFGFNTTDTADGTAALENKTGGFASISSTTGLKNYPSAGDTIRGNLRWASGAQQLEVFYGVQNEVAFPDNMYRLRLDGGDNTFTLRVRSNGSGTRIAGVNYNLSSFSNAYQELEIIWGSSGNHTLSITDSNGTEQVSMSATDTTYTSGGIGFTASSAGAGATKLYDSFSIV